MSTEPYYSTETHLDCKPETGHVCQKPSGRMCNELRCVEPAGTLWGPYWCPDHDAERIDRISRSLAALVHPSAFEMDFHTQPTERGPS